MKLLKWTLYSMVLALVVFRPTVMRFTDPEQAAMPALPDPVKRHLGTKANPMHGIDLSHYNGRVDFKTLAESSLDFVYLKATQGTHYVDPTFSSHASALRAVKPTLLFGAYHFFDPHSDPLEQARHFVVTVKTSGTGLPPVLDVEQAGELDSKQMQDAVKVWIGHVEKALACKPMIYSYADFWKTYLGQPLADYPLWLADYADKPDVPKEAEDWRVWQYSDKGQVQGVEHSVDLDVLVGEALGCYG